MIATIGSLFSGIGGLELGLEAAGLGETVWHCEREPFCRQVLAKWWPGVPCFEDVREVGAATAEPPDILCGGFPCQPFSTAGKRRGVDDERWLWPEFARVIEELAPSFVVIENVVSLRKQGLRFVLRDLAALGYDACWTDLAAADLGAPHNRQRLFVVAWNVPDADSLPLRLESKRNELVAAQSRRLRESLDVGSEVGNTDAQRRPRTLLEEDQRWPRPGDGRTELGGQEVADTDSERLETVAGADVAGRGVEAVADAECERCEGQPTSGLHDQGASGDHDARRGLWPPGPRDEDGWRSYILAGGAQPGIRRGADGLRDRVHADRRARIRALGNAVVPQVAQVVGEVIFETLGVA